MLFQVIGEPWHHKNGWCLHPLRSNLLISNLLTLSDQYRHGLVTKSFLSTTYIRVWQPTHQQQQSVTYYCPSVYRDTSSLWVYPIVKYQVVIPRASGILFSECLSVCPPVCLNLIVCMAVDNLCGRWATNQFLPYNFMFTGVRWKIMLLKLCGRRTLIWNGPGTIPWRAIP